MARILIAEDEGSLRGFLCRALVEDDHDVLMAGDGAEALNLLSHDEKFDLLLTDIKMPVMHGIALALAAARDDPDLTILLMTGYADQHERAYGLDKLIDGIVIKPFSLPEIRAAVAKALASRRQ